jgi:DNA-binding GntR family transcriptional regulator
MLKKAGPKALGGKAQIDTVCRTVFEAIFAQELLPGTKLSEETIGKLFGVSRTLVRAAFNRLHNDSLIEFKPNRGAFVVSPTADEARQIFDARICIEREIAARLAREITREKIRALEAHVAEERKVNEAGDIAASTRLSGEFHLLIAKMVGNEVLTRFLGGLISRSALVMAAHGRPRSTDCGVDEHLEIIAALKSRDPKAAAAAATHHLEHIAERTQTDHHKRGERDLARIFSRYAPLRLETSRA